MKLTLSCVRQTLAVAAVCCVSTVPLMGVAADRLSPTPQVAPLGIPAQQVNYSNYSNNYSGNGSCPNGNCQPGGIGNWGGGYGWGNRGWGGGACRTCGLFGCHGCLHGLAQGNAFVRPPAVWPVARTPNTYQYYWAPQLTGVQLPPVAYPMIYHPTDTTQLGFSYQHVPRWGYRPDMLPPAPVPNWPLGAHTAWGGSFGYGVNYQYGSSGTISGPVYSTATPNAVIQTPIVPTSPVTPAPVPIPMPIETAPAAETPAPQGVVVPPPPVDTEAAVFPKNRR